jgi:hypothetical protein
MRQPDKHALFHPAPYPLPFLGGGFFDQEKPMRYLLAALLLVALSFPADPRRAERGTAPGQIYYKYPL